ncbi:MAG: M23 family metallopeptidase [Chloroflexi bacterium]|nr:M23 family metallopeptidase [Chloroflexota bacterium]
MRKQLPTVAFILALVVISLACSAGGEIDTAPLQQEAYFTCVTATPIPTIASLIGTATPDPMTTPVSTPHSVYSYTTPVPTETPYYRVESFYRRQLTHMDGLVISLHDVRTAGNGPNEGTVIYQATFEVTNRLKTELLVPLSMLVYVRRILSPDDEMLIGRWRPNTEAVEGIEAQPLHENEMRRYALDFVVPRGQIQELGLVTDWESNLEGGVSIWFIPYDDSVKCPYGSADWVGESPPPPPTPGILGMSNVGVKNICGWPASGTKVRGFGCSAYQTGITDPMGCSGAIPYFHNGLDVGAAIGTPVQAPVSGIALVGYDNTLGNYVLVTRGSERHDLLHLDSHAVVNGQSVSAGQIIGAVGNTGNSTGSHLHWTVRQNGMAIDPEMWGGC